jgi:hypothetical protein
MHIRLLTSAFLLACFALAAAGEIICTLGSTAPSYKPSADERPSSDVMQLAQRVNSAFTPMCLPKCPAVAIFRNATAPNAMLTVAGGDAKLVYSPQFFTSVYNGYGEGAILAIIAHEYGHAMDETTPVAWLKRSWTPELRADAWAGCALAKMNLSSKSLAEALTAVSKYPSPAHPSWTLRLPAWRLGYTQCGGDGSKIR